MQINQFCVAQMIVTKSAARAPNGGYLRGHPKSQVTLRDE